MDDTDLRLKWRRTWDDEPKEVEDFAAWDGDKLVGRFYRITSGPEKGKWFWSVPCFHGSPTDETGPGSGRLYGEARETALIVETAYFRWQASGMKVV